MQPTITKPDSMTAIIDKHNRKMQVEVDALIQREALKVAHWWAANYPKRNLDICLGGMGTNCHYFSDSTFYCDDLYSIVSRMESYDGRCIDSNPRAKYERMLKPLYDLFVLFERAMNDGYYPDLHQVQYLPTTRTIKHGNNIIQLEGQHDATSERE